MPTPSTPDDVEIPSEPWPLPEGTRLPDTFQAVMSAYLDALGPLEADVMALVDGAPVRRHPDFPVYLHDLATSLDVLEYAIDGLAALRDHLAEAFCKAVPFGTSAVTYPDTRPLVPRFGGNRTKWENDLLREDVLPLLVADADHPEEIRDRCFSVVSLNGSNVKVTGLRALGLDPDDYCHKVPKAAVVQVVK